MRLRRYNTRAAKLTADKVMLMRSAYAGGATQSELSLRYGLSIGQIGRIVRGESWQQLPTVETDNEIADRLARESLAEKGQGNPLTPEQDAEARRAVESALALQNQLAAERAATPALLYNDKELK